MKIGFIFLFLSLGVSQSTPQHCWDFANQSGDISDACGGGITLERNGKDQLLQMVTMELRFAKTMDATCSRMLGSEELFLLLLLLLGR